MRYVLNIDKAKILANSDNFWLFLSQCYALFGSPCTGLKVRCCPKIDKYQVCTGPSDNNDDNYYDDNDDDNYD